MYRSSPDGHGEGKEKADYIIIYHIPVGLIRRRNVPSVNRFNTSADSHSSPSSQHLPIASSPCTQLSQSPRHQSCPLRPPCLSGYIKKFSNFSKSARDACSPTFLPRYCTHSRGVHSANLICAHFGAC